MRVAPNDRRGEHPLPGDQDPPQRKRRLGPQFLGPMGAGAGALCPMLWQGAKLATLSYVSRMVLRAIRSLLLSPCVASLQGDGGFSGEVRRRRTSGSAQVRNVRQGLGPRRR